MPRYLVAVIGDTHVEAGGEEAHLAETLGRKLIEQGYRIVTGGVGDLPRFVAKGARAAESYRDGDLVAILPGLDPRDAADCADIVIATGLDQARNLLVANSDAVAAIGGGAGTLSEIAFAWTLKRLVLAYRIHGSSGLVAGTRIDQRVRYPEIPEYRVYPVESDSEVADLLRRYLPLYTRRHRGIPGGSVTPHRESVTLAHQPDADPRVGDSR